MFTPSSSGVTKTYTATAYYPTHNTHGATTAVTAPVQTQKYDSLSLSAVDGKSRFQMSMVSRLSQDVRTATSTGDVQRLQQAVSSGSYQPDPMAIAGRILFAWGD